MRMCANSCVRDQAHVRKDSPTLARARVRHVRARVLACVRVLKNACATRYMTKDAVSKAIRTVRGDFVKQRRALGQPVRSPDMKIRPHSGRRHAITMMIKHGVPEVIGMKFANMKNRTVYYR